MTVLRKFCFPHLMLNRVVCLLVQSGGASRADGSAATNRSKSAAGVSKAASVEWAWAELEVLLEENPKWNLVMDVLHEIRTEVRHNRRPRTQTGQPACSRCGRVLIVVADDRGAAQLAEYMNLGGPAMLFGNWRRFLISQRFDQRPLMLHVPSRSPPPADSKTGSRTPAGAKQAGSSSASAIDVDAPDSTSSASVVVSDGDDPFSGGRTDNAIANHVDTLTPSQWESILLRKEMERIDREGMLGVPQRTDRTGTPKGSASTASSSILSSGSLTLPASVITAESASSAVTAGTKRSAAAAQLDVVSSAESATPAASGSKSARATSVAVASATPAKPSGSVKRKTPTVSSTGSKGSASTPKNQAKRTRAGPGTAVVGGRGRGASSNAASGSSKGKGSAGRGNTGSRGAVGDDQTGPSLPSVVRADHTVSLFDPVVQQRMSSWAAASGSSKEQQLRSLSALVLTESKQSDRNSSFMAAASEDIDLTVEAKHSSPDGFTPAPTMPATADDDELDIVIHPAGTLEPVLNSFRPHFVICFDPDVRVIRLVRYSDVWSSCQGRSSAFGT